MPRTTSAHETSVQPSQEEILKHLLETDTTSATLVEGNYDPKTGDFRGEYQLLPDTYHPGGVYVLAFGRKGRSVMRGEPRVWVSMLLSFDLNDNGASYLGNDQSGRERRGDLRGNYLIEQRPDGPVIVHGPDMIELEPSFIYAVDDLVTTLHQAHPLPAPANES